MIAMNPQHFSIVDVETTGLNSIRDRIIEIAVITVDNGKIKHTFKTLVNPDVPIPPEITRLTGITDSKLKNAPGFYDISDHLYSLLHGGIIAAHHARFDYGFLKQEFMRYGTEFTAKPLCTAKLSRLLFPSFRSHSLDALIGRMSISTEHRHRAYDDAKVLFEFFKYIHAGIGSEKISEAIDRVMKRTYLPVSITNVMIDRIPEAPGVYHFFGENGVSLYIGKSNNLKNRVISHFSSDMRILKEMKISKQVTAVNTIRTAGELSASILESQLIKEHLPLYNRRLRQKNKLIILKKVFNEKNILTVSIRESSLLTPDYLDGVIGIYTSKKAARESLLTVGKKYGLCLKYLGLSEYPSACFWQQLGWCKGICIGAENQASYNNRFLQAFRNEEIAKWPFSGAIMIKEQSGQIGYGYVVNRWCLIKTISWHPDSEVNEVRHNISFDRDIYKILYKFLQNPANGRHIFNTDAA